MFNKFVFLLLDFKSVNVIKLNSDLWNMLSSVKVVFHILHKDILTCLIIQGLNLCCVIYA